MSHFAVIREAGPAWTHGTGTFDQPALNDHATFMNTLADEGFVLFAGPLAGSEHGRIRVLLIADAPSEAEVVEERADQRRVQVRRVQLGGLPAGGPGGVDEQQPPAVSVGGDGMRAGLTLPGRPVGEERLQGRGERGHGWPARCCSSRCPARPAAAVSCPA
jgi:uncharacterized protein YciI